MLAIEPSALTARTRPPVAPPMLLPYQQRFLMDPARVRVWEKTRRCGATWAVAAQCVIEAASGRQDVWMLAYSEDGAKQFTRDVADWAERLHVAVKPFDHELVEYDEDGKPITIRALGVTFPGSNKRITALASNPRGLRGKAGMVVIDEGAFHDDLAEVLKAAMALLMWGGEVVILSSHRGAESEFNKLVEEIRDGKRPGFSLHRTSIVDALNEGLYARICLARGLAWSKEGQDKWLADLERDYGDGHREELYCEPVGGGDVYLPRALVRECMVMDAPVVRYSQDESFMALSEDTRRVEVADWLEANVRPLLDELQRGRDVSKYQAFGFGMDFGRVSDLSVLAPIGLRQNRSRRVPFILELHNVPFNQQWQIVKYVMGGLPRLMFSVLDAGGNGAWVAEQAWLGFGGDDSVERVQLTLAYYRTHFPALKRVMEDRAIQLPSDLDVLADLAKVRRINGVPKVPDVRSDAVVGKGKRHGDAAIALLLANAACDKAEAIFTRWNAFCVE